MTQPKNQRLVTEASLEDTTTVPGQFLATKVPGLVATALASSDVPAQAAAAAVTANIAGRDLVESTDSRIPKKIPEQDYVDGFGDQDGNVALGIRADGSIDIPLLQVKKLNGVSSEAVLANEYVEFTADAGDRVSHGLRTDGKYFISQLVVHSIEGFSGQPTASTRTIAEPEWSTKKKSWDPRLALYNAHPLNARRWDANLAKARRGVGTAHSSFHVDSRMYGASLSGVSSPKWLNSIPGRIRQHFDRLCNVSAGTGISPFWDQVFGTPTHDPRMTWGAGVTSMNTYGGTIVSTNYGPLETACFRLNNSTGTGWVEFAPTQSVDRFSVLFVAEDSSTGLATIFVDGVSKGTVSLAPVASGGTLTRRTGTQANQIVVDIGGLTPGTHKLRIEGSATETTNLIWAEGATGAGVRISNLARSSTQLAHLTVDDTTHRRGMSLSFDLPNADMAVIMPISNDRLGTKAVVKEYLRKAIIRQKATGGSVLLVAPCQPDYVALGSGTEENWKLLVTAMYELADEYDIRLLDLTWAWQDHASSNALGLFGDAIHENDAGAELVAWSIYNALTGA